MDDESSDFAVGREEKQTVVEYREHLWTIGREGKDVMFDDGEAVRGQASLMEMMMMEREMMLSGDILGCDILREI